MKSCLRQVLAVLWFLTQCICTQAQCIQLLRIFEEDKPISLPEAAFQKLDSILNNAQIPYECLTYKGTSLYYVEFQDSIKITIIKSINHRLDSILGSKIKEASLLDIFKEFDRTGKIVGIRLSIDFEHIDYRKILDVPVDTFKKSVTSDETMLLFELMSESNLLPKEKDIYHLKKDFKVQDHIVAIKKLDSDSLFFLTYKMPNCLEPPIYSLYLLINNTLSKLAVFQLYDFEPIEEIIKDRYLIVTKPVVITPDVAESIGYLKEWNEPLDFNVKRGCADGRIDPEYKKALELKKLGNCIGLISPGTITYRISSNYELKDRNAGNYNILFADNRSGFKIFVGGWVE